MEEIDLRKYLSKLPAHKLGRIRYNQVNIRYKYLMDGKRPSYRTFGYFINTVLMNQAESLFYEITQKIITKEQRQDEKVQSENTVTQEKAKE